MTTKSMTIEFYQGVVGTNGNADTVSGLMAELADADPRPVITIKGMQHEIRDLRSYNRGASLSGVFAKFRQNDIPHAGAPGGAEHKLDLEEEEGLLEKNHFLYFREHELLVYQRNGNGSTTMRLAAYCSVFNNEAVAFNPVLQLEPMRRLMRNNVLPRRLDLTVARPTNPALFPDDEWNNNLMRVMTEAGGMRIHARITADARSADRNDWYLSDRIKRSINELVSNDLASVAKLRVEEDGIVHPIDLIADRLLSQKDVEMDERYPVPESIYAALRQARNDERETLQEIFGAQGHALD